VWTFQKLMQGMNSNLLKIRYELDHIKIDPMVFVPKNTKIAPRLCRESLRPVLGHGKKISRHDPATTKKSREFVQKKFKVFLNLVPKIQIVLIFLLA
jgi:hypothetical protein